MSVKLSNPRGTVDILPSDMPFWCFIENSARTILETYGYREIRTPFFEEAALFKRSLGESTEVVNKQLLGVASQNRDADQGAGFALRPEGTASVVRAFNQHDIGRENYLSRLFYIGAMFRGERPQKGRLRQFHQIGAEAIGRGADHPLLDAEMIILAVHLLKAFGVNDFKVRINSLGTAEDKAAFAGWLREALKPHVGGLNEECRGQYERNVFRLLDSKDADCQALIRQLDIGTRHLSAGGLEYFSAVRCALDDAGVVYEVSPHLVRGLDYYTHTVFEISYAGLGAQDALGAGGRYNGLVEQLGGGDRRNPVQIGAIGFALGMERIMLALEHQGLAAFPAKRLAVFVATGHRDFESSAFKLANELRAQGISTEMDFGNGRPLKKQFELADKLGAKFVVILGVGEAGQDSVNIKDMTAHEQKTLSRGAVVDELKKLCLK